MPNISIDDDNDDDPSFEATTVPSQQPLPPACPGSALVEVVTNADLAATILRISMGILFLAHEDAYAPASARLLDSIDAYLDALEAEPLTAEEDSSIRLR